MAARARVSPATVSLVLNGSTSVAPKYRSRVLKAVNDLDYRPNRLARHFRLQRADVIGILVSDIENPHFTSMVRALEDEAYKRGKRVLLCNTDESAEKQGAYLEMMASDRVLGVILSPSDPADPGIAALLDLGTPVVAFDRVAKYPRADAVIADNFAVGRQPTELLLRAGHTRLGCISGPSEVQTAADRLAGYDFAVRAAGLKPASICGLFKIEGARRATHELLDAAPDLTGLVVTNNLMTIGALEALRTRAIAIPDSMALVAIDDPFWSDLVHPPLTTIAQPIRLMAESALGLLFQRMNAPKGESRLVTFPLELRVRVSCGHSPIDLMVALAGGCRRLRPGCRRRPERGQGHEMRNRGGCGNDPGISACGQRPSRRPPQAACVHRSTPLPHGILQAGARTGTRGWNSVRPLARAQLSARPDRSGLGMARIRL
jgi:LacI family transcriptional regulator, galactose operon repressor